MGKAKHDNIMRMHEHPFIAVASVAVAVVAAIAQVVANVFSIVVAVVVARCLARLNSLQ